MSKDTNDTSMNTQKSKSKILYLYPRQRSSFVAKDIKLLSERYEVVEFLFRTKPKFLLPFELVRLKLFLLRNLFSIKLYVVMFAGYWSLLPAIFAKIFGKRNLIITGGTDCVSFPEIGYGNFQNPLIAWFTKQSFKLSTRIVALHSSMILADYKYLPLTYKRQGIKAFVPNLKTEIDIIENGYDAAFWRPQGSSKSKTFLSVALGIENAKTRNIKGYDLILEVAKNYPSYEFVFVGLSSTQVDFEVPANVQLHGKTNAEELRKYYSQSQFYLQLSMSEGFPNALCEAMLCECVPIVSAVASMPEIVGSSGFILPQKDLNLLTQIIEKALQSDLEQLGKAARHRISSQYTEQMRAEKLNSLIKNLMDKK